MDILQSNYHTPSTNSKIRVSVIHNILLISNIQVTDHDIMTLTLVLCDMALSASNSVTWVCLEPLFLHMDDLVVFQGPLWQDIKIGPSSFILFLFIRYHFYITSKYFKPFFDEPCIFSLSPSEHLIDRSCSQNLEVIFDHFLIWLLYWITYLSLIYFTIYFF